ncbi:MAG TPA: SH3 domain-containing protein [Acetobacteraceae bacterium]|nr:SH3 domain-containing protein [Acetobacteraceae bacterium]
MMLPLPPGWLCLQDCNLSGQLNQPVVVPFVLIHPDVGVALIDIAPASNPEADSILRQRLETARFGSIFPGFLPILHLRLDRADLPSTESILRDAFASRPPISVPGGDGWVSVVRRALLPRDPGRTAAHSGSLLATHLQRSPRSVGPAAWGGSETGSDMLRREVTAHADDDADPSSFEPVVPERAAAPTTPPIIWIIMSGVGGLIAVLALFTLLIGRADAPNAGGETASAPTASVAPPAAPPPLAAPAPAIATAPPSVTSAAPTSVPAPDLVASLPKPPPVAAPPPPPAATAAAVPARPPQPPPVSPPAAPAPATAAIPARPPQPLPPPAPDAPSTASAAGAGAPVAPAPAQRPAATVADRLPRVTLREPSNLRTGPDGQSNVVRVVPRGETLRVHNRAPNGWVQVGDAEPMGWIHNSRLGAIE